MNQENKESKKKGRWGIALAILLLIAFGGGWWLWGKNLIKEPATKPEAGNNVSSHSQVNEAVPAPGGDEGLLAEAEKVDSQIADTVWGKSKQPGKMIEYKKRLIKDFGPWNSGEDSLHKKGSQCDECPPPIGPYGLLVNKEGNIYIFDLVGITCYNSKGFLMRKGEKGRPLGVDGLGNIYAEYSIYDSNLTLVKRYSIPSQLASGNYYSYVSPNGKIYYLISKRNDNTNIRSNAILECDPYSNNLVIDQESARYNPNMPPSLVMPCNTIDVNSAPIYMRLAKLWEDNNLPEELRGINTKIIHEPNLQLTILKLLAVDNDSNSYWLYELNSLAGDNLAQTSLGILNNEGNFISSIQLCNDTVELVDPTGRERYIFIDSYFGNVYQLCTDNDTASLIVWEK